MVKKKNSEKFSVLAHELVPDMEILSETQKKNILSKLNITENMLPLINHNDPEALALKAEPGDVIKIERKEPTAKCTYYRLVE